MNEMEISLNLLTSTNPIHRRRAVEGLAGTKDIRAAVALVEALGDEDPFVRKGAVMALGEMGEAVVPTMIWALGHEDSDVRGGSANVFGIIGDVRAVPSLVEALNDNEMVYPEADEALRNILWGCDTPEKVQQFELGLETGAERLPENLADRPRSRPGAKISLMREEIAAKKGEVGARMDGVQSPGTVPKPRGEGANGETPTRGKRPVGR